MRIVIQIGYVGHRESGLNRFNIGLSPVVYL